MFREFLNLKPSSPFFLISKLSVLVPLTGTSSPGKRQAFHGKSILSRIFMLFLYSRLSHGPSSFFWRAKRNQAGQTKTNRPNENKPAGQQPGTSRRHKPSVLMIYNSP